MKSLNKQELLTTIERVCEICDAEYFYGIEKDETEEERKKLILLLQNNLPNSNIAEMLIGECADPWTLAEDILEMAFINQSVRLKYLFLREKKLTKQQLVELLTKLYANKTKFYNTDDVSNENEDIEDYAFYEIEKENDEIVEIINRNVPVLSITNVMDAYPGLTPEEIVEKALAYEPIRMPGPKWGEE